MSETVVRIPTDRFNAALLPWHKQILQVFDRKQARFFDLCIHRRARKTTLAVNLLIREAANNPKSVYVYVGPTYKQAKAVVWTDPNMLFSALPDQKYYGWEKNESDLTIKFPNKSLLVIKGGDDPDSLRGIDAAGVAFDEWSMMRPEIYSEIFRPIITQSSARWAMFMYTPKGRNHAYEMHIRAQKGLADWYSLTLDAASSGIIPADELAKTRFEISEILYEQEFMCDFHISVEGAIYAKELKKVSSSGRLRKLRYDPSSLVYTAWDLGVGDATAIWFFQISGPDIMFLDYYENCGEGLPFYAKVLDDKRIQNNWVYGKHFGPHDLEVKELGTGITRIEAAKKLGIIFTVIPRSSLTDGIETTRNMLHKCYFDEDLCADGFKNLCEYRWKQISQYTTDEKPIFSNNPEHDWCSHAADSLRYGSQAIAMGLARNPAVISDPKRYYHANKLSAMAS